MGNGIAEEVAVALKVVDGRIWSCDDAVAAVAVAWFFFLLLLGAHCDVDGDIWSVFGSRVVGADFRKNKWACWFVFFSLSFGKSKLYVCLLQLSTPSNVNVIGEFGCFQLTRAQR